MPPSIILGLLGLGKHKSLRFEACAGDGRGRREVTMRSDFSYEDTQIRDESDDRGSTALDRDAKAGDATSLRREMTIVGRWRARGAVEMGAQFEILFLPTDADVAAYSVDIAGDKSFLRVDAHAISDELPALLRRSPVSGDGDECFSP